MYVMILRFQLACLPSKTSCVLSIYPIYFSVSLIFIGVPSPFWHNTLVLLSILPIIRKYQISQMHPRACVPTISSKWITSNRDRKRYSFVNSDIYWYRNSVLRNWRPFRKLIALYSRHLSACEIIFWNGYFLYCIFVVFSSKHLI